MSFILRIKIQNGFDITGMTLKGKQHMKHCMIEAWHALVANCLEAYKGLHLLCCQHLEHQQVKAMPTNKWHKCDSIFQLA